LNATEEQFIAEIRAVVRTAVIDVTTEASRRGQPLIVSAAR
jgi:hypothetical protein